MKKLLLPIFNIILVFFFRIAWGLRVTDQIYSDFLHLKKLIASDFLTIPHQRIAKRFIVTAAHLIGGIIALAMPIGYSIFAGVKQGWRITSLETKVNELDGRMAELELNIDRVILNMKKDHASLVC